MVRWGWVGRYAYACTHGRCECVGGGKGWGLVGIRRQTMRSGGSDACTHAGGKGQGGTHAGGKGQGRALRDGEAKRGQAGKQAGRQASSKQADEQASRQADVGEGKGRACMGKTRQAWGQMAECNVRALCALAWSRRHLMQGPRPGREGAEMACVGLSVGRSDRLPRQTRQEGAGALCLPTAVAWCATPR